MSNPKEKSEVRSILGDEYVRAFEFFQSIGATHVQQVRWLNFYKRVKKGNKEDYDPVGVVLPCVLTDVLRPTDVYCIEDLIGKEEPK